MTTKCDRIVVRENEATGQTIRYPIPADVDPAPVVHDTKGWPWMLKAVLPPDTDR